MADAPKRACRFVLDLEADTRDDLATALYNIASQLERGELTKGVSGGYSSGFIYELVENDGPTHDEWARNLRAYLDAKKDESGVAPTAPHRSVFDDEIDPNVHDEIPRTRGVREGGNG